MADARAAILEPDGPPLDDALVRLGDASVGDGLVAVLEPLTDQLLHWTDVLRQEVTPDSVHQARVATRRLRSALSIYRRVLPALARLDAGVKHYAALLGAVRDWDVFIVGTGAALAAAGDGDRRVGLLLRAAGRKRAAAAAALTQYIDDAGFREWTAALGTTVAQGAETAQSHDPAVVETPTALFSAEVLTRRLRHVRRLGRSIDDSPIDALHELRKDCKRLRYTAEFFAPAFPGRPAKSFLRRLADLQGHLGALNDSAACPQLMAQLGRTGRGYAGGLAQGLAAAGAQPERARIVKSWKRFRRTDPFWK